MVGILQSGWAWVSVIGLGCLGCLGCGGVLVAAEGDARPPVATSGSPEIPAEQRSEAERWIEKLGSESYAEREQAQAALAALGRMARPALAAALYSHPNPEVRRRCAELLPLAVAADFKARIDMFLADTAGQYDHDLPGWTAFRQMVCNEWRLWGYTIGRDRRLEPIARRFFAQILQDPANREFLFTFWQSPQKGELVRSRREELQASRYPQQIVVINGTVVRPNLRIPTMADIATLLFLEAYSGASVNNPRLGTITTLLQGTPFERALRENGEFTPLLRELVRVWAASRREPQEMYTVMNWLATAGLSEDAARVALRLLLNPMVMPYQRGQALSHLIKSADTTLLPLLENLFEDQTVIYSMTQIRVVNGQQQRVVTQVELRDAALAAAILLSGQRPTDYGFTDRMAQQNNDMFYYHRYYFADDPQRTAAFERWKRERSGDRPPQQPADPPRR